MHCINSHIYLIMYSNQSISGEDLYLVYHLLPHKYLKYTE